MRSRRRSITLARAAIALASAAATSCVPAAPPSSPAPVTTHATTELVECPSTCVVDARGCFDPTTAGCGGAARDGTQAEATTRAIQAAMNCAVSFNPSGAAGLHGGAPVCLPQGRYLVSETLRVRAPRVRMGDAIATLVSNGLVVRGAGRANTELLAAHPITMFASDDPESVRFDVGFEDFAIRFEDDGKAGIGIDLTGMSDSHVTRVGVGFNPRSGRAAPFGIGVYARGHAKGAAPYGDRIEELTYSSHHGVAPDLAVGIDFEPQDRATAPTRGVNQALVLGGTIRGADVGIKITSGTGNTVIGVNIEGDTRVHYEFGDPSMLCGPPELARACAVSNRVLGGTDEGNGDEAGKDINYYVRFNRGAWDNVLDAGYVTSLMPSRYGLPGQSAIIANGSDRSDRGESGNLVRIGSSVFRQPSHD